MELWLMTSAARQIPWAVANARAAGIVGFCLAYIITLHRGFKVCLADATLIWLNLKDGFAHY